MDVTEVNKIIFSNYRTQTRRNKAILSNFLAFKSQGVHHGKHIISELAFKTPKTSGFTV